MSLEDQATEQPLLSSSRQIDISWENLTYSVKMKDSTKVVLDNVTGYCRSGQTLAIIGASGAGKTSLLNILSCRINQTKQNTIDGQLNANGQPYNSKQFGNFAAYVMQNDILFDTLTPRECLKFAADLKIKGTDEYKNQIVEKIIKQLKLTSAANTYIGSAFVKGISGGERKRTSIGVELITDPAVLFLDEPTSGLDSFTAYRIVSILKNQADQGKTVIFTIHQPSSDIYALFDRLLLLVEGKVTYQGYAQQAQEYFDKLDYHMPRFFNPGDYLMQILNQQTSENEEANKKIQETYSTFCLNYDNVILPQITEDIRSLNNQQIKQQERANSSLTEIKYICQRAWTNFKRNPQLLQSRIAYTIFNIILVYSMYWRLGRESITDLKNRLGYLFFASVGQFFGTLGPVSLLFPAERQVFLREENSGLYRIHSYFIGKLLVELPLLLVFPTIVSIGTYWGVGLNDSSFYNVLIFILINDIQAFNGLTVGIMTGCLFKDPKISVALTNILLIPFLVFGGFYINEGDIPIYLRWLKYTSPFKYALEALTYNEFENFHENYPLLPGPDPMELLSQTLGLWPSTGLLASLGVVFILLAYILLRSLVTKTQ